MQISAEHLVGLVLFGMTPMLGLYAAGILWRFRKAKRDALKKRIRDDDMKEARAIWGELDDDGNDIINGPELKGLSNYIRGTEHRKGMGDAELEADLLQRCSSGKPVTWAEFSSWIRSRNERSKKIQSDAMEAMREKDPLATSTTGQMIVVVEILSRLEEHMQAIQCTAEQRIPRRSANEASKSKKGRWVSETDTGTETTDSGPRDRCTPADGIPQPGRSAAGPYNSSNRHLTGAAAEPVDSGYAAGAYDSGYALSVVDGRYHQTTGDGRWIPVSGPQDAARGNPITTAFSNDPPTDGSTRTATTTNPLWKV